MFICLYLCACFACSTQHQTHRNEQSEQNAGKVYSQKESEQKSINKANTWKKYARENQCNQKQQSKYFQVSLECNVLILAYLNRFLESD